MTRTSLDDGLWAPLMLTMQQIPHAWTRDEAALRRFVRLRCGSAGRARQARLRRACLRRITSRWRDLPDNLGRWPSVYHCFRRWSVHGWWELVFQARPPALPADGLALLDSTIGKACRVAPGAARSNAEAECLNRSRGGQCSKLHVCADGAGRILRLAPSHREAIPRNDVSKADRGQHSGPRHAPARLRAAFAADGCAVHSPPKLGMVDPSPWDRTIYLRRHHVENLFSKLKDRSRIALRHDETGQSWMGFAHLIASAINLRVAEFSRRL